MAQCGRGLVPGMRPTKCRERVDAERAGTLVWDAGRGAYVLTDVPLRHSSARARYYAQMHGTELAEGEPIVWVDCPWCGGELVPGDGQLLLGSGDAAA